MRSLLAAALALAAFAAHAAPDIAPTANVQYDVAHLDGAGAGDDATSAFRRARLGFKAQGTRWQFVAEHDFADRTPADAWLEFTPAKGHALRVGQFKQPFLLEDAISDKQSPMLETSPLGAFAFGRRIGAEYARYGSRGTLNVAAFDQRVDGTQKSRGATLRGTWLLRQGGGEILHVGGSLAFDRPGNARASFSTNAGTPLIVARLAGSGTLRGVDRIDRAGVEAVWIRGAGSVQAEAARLAVHRDGAPTYDADAQSVTATWSPTGQARSYKRGVPGTVAANGHVAWELAARWSAIDFDDGGIAGGRVRQVAVSAISTLNPHLRIGGSLVRSTAHGRAANPLLATVRVQLTY